MKLYADPITVNCRKVIAGLEHMGAPYERVHVDYFQGAQKSPEYTSLNPNACLPTLVDGDFVLWESNAILAYAAEKIGNTRVWPQDLRTRADMQRWLLWESSSWFPACYAFLVENCVKPVLGDSPDLDALEGYAVRFHKLAKILDDRLASNQWVSGTPEPTVADIALAAPMHLHGWQKLPLQPHANLRRWMHEGIERLPAWEKTWVGEGFTLDRSAA